MHWSGRACWQMPEYDRPAPAMAPVEVPSWPALRQPKLPLRPRWSVGGNGPGWIHAGRLISASAATAMVSHMPENIGGAR